MSADAEELPTTLPYHHRTRYNNFHSNYGFGSDVFSQYYNLHSNNGFGPELIDAYSSSNMLFNAQRYYNLHSNKWFGSMFFNARSYYDLYSDNGFGPQLIGLCSSSNIFFNGRRYYNLFSEDGFCPQLLGYSQHSSSDLLFNDDAHNDDDEPQSCHSLPSNDHCDDFVDVDDVFGADEYGDDVNNGAYICGDFVDVDDVFGADKYGDGVNGTGICGDLVDVDCALPKDKDIGYIFYDDDINGDDGHYYYFSGARAYTHDFGADKYGDSEEEWRLGAGGQEREDQKERDYAACDEEATEEEMYELWYNFCSGDVQVDDFVYVDHDDDFDDDDGDYTSGTDTCTDV